MTRSKKRNGQKLSLKKLKIRLPGQRLQNKRPKGKHEQKIERNQGNNVWTK